MTFKLILSDSIRFFWDNLHQIAILCFPFLIAGAMINNILLGRLGSASDISSVFLLWFALTLALYPLYTISLILVMVRRAERERPTNSQIISDTLKLYFPYLMLVIIALGLVWLGSLLFILPGIWLGVRLAFAGFFLVVHQLDPREALIASFKSTRPYFFQILATLALFFLTSFVLAVLIGNMLNTMQSGDVLNIIADTVISSLSLFVHVVLFRIFMQATHENPYHSVDTHA